MFNPALLYNTPLPASVDMVTTDGYIYIGRNRYGV